MRTGIDAIEADEDDPAPGGLSLYPLIGIALMLASAALVCGGLLYLLKRFGLPHP